MNSKVLVHLSKKSGELVDIFGPFIVEIRNLYDEFLEDFAHYNQLSGLQNCFEEQKIRLKPIDEIFIEAEREKLSYDKIKHLEIYVTDILAQYSVFLNNLKNICGEKIYTLITHFIYDENRNYRILAELRNIVQHKNKLHFYYIEEQLVFDFEEVLKGYKITIEKYNKTFLNLSKIPAANLWAMIKETQEYLTMYLYIAVSNVNKLKRFYACLIKYDNEDKNLAIRTTLGNHVTYEYVFTSTLKVLIKLSETAPQICKDKILPLIKQVS